MEKYVFNFKKFPSLLSLYKKYRDLELTATKHADGSAKKYDAAVKARDDFGYNILAKEIFNTFNPIKPKLHKRRGESGCFAWNDVFCDDYDSLDEKQKKCLIGLIYRLFVYELPDEYYVE